MKPMHFLAASFGLAALLIAGCGDSSMGQVSGKITVNGQPVEGIVVTFNPQFDEGSPSSGLTDADGRYTAKFSMTEEGVQVGKHKITFEGDDDDGESTLPFEIPAEYNEESEIILDVTPGSQTFDRDLEIAM